MLGSKTPGVTLACRYVLFFPQVVEVVEVFGGTRYGVRGSAEVKTRKVSSTRREAPQSSESILVRRAAPSELRKTCRASWDEGVWLLILSINVLSFNIVYRNHLVPSQYNISFRVSTRVVIWY